MVETTTPTPESLADDYMTLSHVNHATVETDFARDGSKSDKVVVWVDSDAHSGYEQGIGANLEQFGYDVEYSTVDATRSVMVKGTKER